jgi:hypothetical protein
MWSNEARIRFPEEEVPSPRLQPMVLWISGQPGDGKSELGVQLERRGVPLFLTDYFVMALPDWCEDAFIVGHYNECGVNAVDAFLDRMVEQQRAAAMAKLFLDPERGFRPAGPLSVIEGYMPLEIQRRVMAELEASGCYVWVVMRPAQLDVVRLPGNWRRGSSPGSRT